MENKEINVDFTRYETRLTKKFLNRKPYEKPNDKIIKTVIPGTILELFVKNGDVVKKGDKLLILEAMKMKNVLRAARDGKIKNVAVSVGMQVPKGDILLEFES
ncbi:MAG: acetyl-CoA carboxylase biotin carboxyl carrier protein subunit [Ignavibacteria bacterium]|nr:acetyl-CoA carboxylase biotin carboxyl carrier protein subunit [Ignavibacteria bacterium]